MKSLTEYMTFDTERRVELLNITSKIEMLVQKSGVQEGLCLVNAMHITASVFIFPDTDTIEPGRIMGMPI